MQNITCKKIFLIMSITNSTGQVYSSKTYTRILLEKKTHGSVIKKIVTEKFKWFSVSVQNKN